MQGSSVSNTTKRPIDPWNTALEDFHLNTFILRPSDMLTYLFKDGFHF